MLEIHTEPLNQNCFAEDGILAGKAAPVKLPHWHLTCSCTGETTADTSKHNVKFGSNGTSNLAMQYKHC